MAQYRDKSAGAQKAIDQVVAYLHENNQRSYATAVQNAAGRVITHESGQMRVGNYSRKVNKWLTEALFMMNSDPYCPDHLINITRKLIESYRQMNGMSTDDFCTDVGDVIRDIDKEAPFVKNLADMVDELDGNDVGIKDVKNGQRHSSADELIIQNTLVGEEYDVDAIMSFLSDQNVNVATLNIETDKAIDVIKQLIVYGYFEVTERDPINGKILSVLRIR